MRSKLLCGIAVFEGADCGGKSTEIRDLVENHGAKVIHNRLWPNMWRYHVAAVRLALKWADHGLVCLDRMWLSEMAYGQTFRGGSCYNHSGPRSLDRVLMRAGAVNVICSPDDQEFQIKRHAARAARGEEVYRKVQQVVALYADLVRGNAVHPGDSYLDQLIRYGDFAKREDVFCYDLDKDGHRLAYVSKQILSRIKKLRSHQLPSALQSNRPNFTGNLAMARSVIVGDSISPQVARLPKGPYWPMTWHDGMSAATWLNKALHLIGHDETTTVITNANDTDDHLTKLLHEHKLRIVTLGKRATDGVMRRGGIPDVEMEHPQYHRRFHHSELNDYAIRLKKALSSS